MVSAGVILVYVDHQAVLFGRATANESFESIPQSINYRRADTLNNRPRNRFLRFRAAVHQPCDCELRFPDVDFLCRQALPQFIRAGLISIAGIEARVPQMARGSQQETVYDFLRSSVGNDIRQ
jgi:hypothetical protein